MHRLFRFPRSHLLYVYNQSLVYTLHSKRGIPNNQLDAKRGEQKYSG